MTKLITTHNETFQTKHAANIPSLSFTHNFLKTHFFLSIVLEWNKLTLSYQNSASHNVFKSRILKFICPSPKKFFQYHDPKRFKLATRLRLGLSHLWECKLKHSFQDTLNPLCSCSFDIEITFLYFHGPLFYAEHFTLLNYINEIDSTILKKVSQLWLISCYMATNFSRMNGVNLLTLNATLDFSFFINRFDVPLYLLSINKFFSFYSWLYGYNFTIFEILIFIFGYYLFLYPWHP